MPPSRHFLPWEINHLKRFSIDPSSISADNHSPVEYLSGFAEFKQTYFKVNQHTLIPRIETEQIVDLSTSHLRELRLNPISILDLGCGSGVIGITLAKYLLENTTASTHLTLADISPQALDVAKENSSTHLKSPHLKLFLQQSNLFDQIPSQKFHVIVANLPYIPSNNISKLDPSVKNYEPLQALDGGETGTELINKALSKIPQYLHPQGIAIFEIDDTHSISSFLTLQSLAVSLKNDEFGIGRFLILQLK